jgi:TP901 family phage tail tape measure protein
MSSAPVSKTVNIYINHAAAERSAEKLQKAFDKLSAAIKKGEAAGKDMSKEVERLGQLRSKLDEVKAVIDGKMSPAIRTMRSHVKDLRRELEAMSKDAPGYAEKFESFKAASTTLDKMEEKVKKVSNAMKAKDSFWNMVKGVAYGTVIGSLVQSGIDKVVEYIQNIISGNARLSDSLADVQRVTGFTREQVQGLYSDLRKLNTRTSTQGLLDIAIIAGKLGIAKDDIVSFVAATDQLTVALGDELGNAEQVTTELGKIINVYKNGAQVTGDEMMKIGNAIVQLANDGVATGSFIVDFTGRLGGLAQTAHIGLNESIGLAAGLEELGQRSESASTAVIKLVTHIGSDVPKFARIAGKDIKEFAATLAEKPIEALIQVAEGLQKDKKSFAEITAAFKDAGEEGARVISTLGVLGGKSDFLRNKIDIAGKSLNETAQITEAFNLKNETLGATLDKIGKKMYSWFTNSAIKEGLNSLVKGFAELTGVLDSSAEALNDFKNQEAAFNNLSATIPPLLSRIDELQFKTSLSKDEQVELKNAINSVATSIPDAVTQFDKYGNVLGISTEKAREFIRQNQLLLKEKNRDAIKDNQEKLKDLVDERAMYSQSLNRSLNMLKQFERDGMTKMANDQRENIKTYRSQLAELNERIQGTRNIIRELKGEPLVEPSMKEMNATKQPTATPPPISPPLDDKAAQRAADKLTRVRDEIIRLKEEVEAKERDLLKNAKENDEQEIARIHIKYQKLINEVVHYTAELAQLKNLERRELATLLQKQFTDRSAKEYEESLKAASDFYNRQRQQAAIDYQNNLVDKSAYTLKLKQLDEDEASDRVTIANDYAETVKKAAEDLETFKTAALQKGVANRENIEKLHSEEKVYSAERQLLSAKKFTKEELAAHLHLLQVQFEQETEMLDQHSEAYKLKTAKHDQAILEAKQTHFQNLVQIAQQALQSITAAFTDYFIYLNAQDEALLEKDRHVNEEKKKNYQQQLRDKRISEAEYNRQVEKLDKELAKKQTEIRRKEFNRNKALSLVNAAINGAMAITSIWAQYAAQPVVAGILTAIAAAANATQLILIGKQKFPEYGKGGKVPVTGKGGKPDGPSHAEDGIALVNSKTGQKIGEMEGGEPILSNATYENNKPIIDALLQSSMYNNGAPIKWLYTIPPPINTRRYNDSVIGNRMFANGGKTAEPSLRGTKQTTAKTEYIEKPVFDNETLSALKNFTLALNKGVKADLVWTEFQRMQKQHEELKQIGSLGG